MPLVCIDFRPAHERRFLAGGWGLRDVRGPYLQKGGGRLEIPTEPPAPAVALGARLSHLQIAFESTARLQLPAPRLMVSHAGEQQERSCVPNGVTVFNFCLSGSLLGSPLLVVLVDLVHDGPADVGQQDLVAIDSLHLRYEAVC